MALSPAARRRRTAVRGVAAAVGFVMVVGGGAAGIAAFLRHLEDQDPAVVRCSAQLEGTSWHLDPDQADTAGLLSATALRRGLPARAVTIAIATGLQESKLRNIDYGDRDSVGIFQQRPSQGWGTVDEIMDPVYSTNAFYDGLDQVDGYQSMAVTEAAQAVQRSGFPDAYAQHEVRSRAWASALTGHSPAAVTCTLPAPSSPGDPTDVVERVGRDFGDLPTTVEDSGAVLVDASALGGDEAAERLGWAVAQWAVSVAQPLEVVAVQHTDHVWDRADGEWAAAELAPTPPGQVRLVLAD